MSADGNSLCPRCKGVDPVAREKIQGLEKKLEDGYGKLPPKEYQKLLKELQKAQRDHPRVDDECLEEYHELGVGTYWQNTPEGKALFRVSYGARCRLCSFTFDFELTSNPIDPDVDYAPISLEIQVDESDDDDDNDLEDEDEDEDVDLRYDESEEDEEDNDDDDDRDDEDVVDMRVFPEDEE